MFPGYDPRVPARYGHGSLVALHLTDVVELRDVVALVYVPLFDGHLFDALADVGQQERHHFFGSTAVAGGGEKAISGRPHTSGCRGDVVRPLGSRRGHAFPISVAPEPPNAGDDPVRSHDPSREHAGWQHVLTRVGS